MWKGERREEQMAPSLSETVTEPKKSFPAEDIPDLRGMLLFELLKRKGKEKRESKGKHERCLLGWDKTVRNHVLFHKSNEWCALTKKKQCP